MDIIREIKTTFVSLHRDAPGDNVIIITYSVPLCSETEARFTAICTTVMVCQVILLRCIFFDLTTLSVEQTQLVDLHARLVNTVFQLVSSGQYWTRLYYQECVGWVYLCAYVRVYLSSLQAFVSHKRWYLLIPTIARFLLKLLSKLNACFALIDTLDYKKRQIICQNIFESGASAFPFVGTEHRTVCVHN